MLTCAWWGFHLEGLGRTQRLELAKVKAGEANRPRVRREPDELLEEIAVGGAREVEK